MKVIFSYNIILFEKLKILDIIGRLESLILHISPISIISRFLFYIVLLVGEIELKLSSAKNIDFHYVN